MIFCEEFGCEILKCENDIQGNHKEVKWFSVNCVDLEKKVNHTTICRVIDDTILINMKCYFLTEKILGFHHWSGLFSQLLINGLMKFANKMQLSHIIVEVNLIWINANRCD